MCVTMRLTENECSPSFCDQSLNDPEMYSLSADRWGIQLLNRGIRHGRCVAFEMARACLRIGGRTDDGEKETLILVRGDEASDQNTPYTKKRSTDRRVIHYATCCLVVTCMF